MSPWVIEHSKKFSEGSSENQTVRETVVYYTDTFVVIFVSCAVHWCFSEFTTTKYVQTLFFLFVQVTFREILILEHS